MVLDVFAFKETILSSEGSPLERLKRVDWTEEVDVDGIFLIANGDDFPGFGNEEDEDELFRFGCIIIKKENKPGKQNIKSQRPNIKLKCNP